MFLETTISAYNNVVDTESKPTTIGNFIKSVREGRYRDKIEYLRSLDKAAADLYKKSLPGITVSGIFSNNSRKCGDLSDYSGLIAMDFDYLDYTILPETKRRLKEDPYSAVVSISASGRGLFVIVKIGLNDSKYRDYFEALTKYYKDKYDLTADPATKNISRLRFVSYDPDIYVNEESDMFDLDKTDISFDFGDNIVPEACKSMQNEIKPVTSDSSPLPDDSRGIDDLSGMKKRYNDAVKVIELAEKRKTPVTGRDDLYPDWFNMGLALSEFGEEGRELFHRASKINPRKYNKGNCNYQYSNILKLPNRFDGITLNSFFGLAKRAGIPIQEVVSKETEAGLLEERKGLPLIYINDVKEVELEFQVDDIWPVNSVGYLSGQPGTWKTWLTLDMAVSIASGTEFLGKYATKQGKVMYFNAEDNPAMTTRMRIAAFCAHRGVTLEGLEIQLIDVPSITLNDGDTMMDLEATIRKAQPDMLILDPLRNIHTLNENDSTEMAPIFQQLRDFNRNYGVSILLVCHDRKSHPGVKHEGSAAGNVRGSNSLVGWRDVAISTNLLPEAPDNSDNISLEIYNRQCPSIPNTLITPEVEKCPESHKALKAHFRIKTYQENEDLEEMKEASYQSQVESEIKALFKKTDKGIGFKEIEKTIKRKRKNCSYALNDLVDSGFLIKVSGMYMKNVEPENDKNEEKLF